MYYYAKNFWFHGQIDFNKINRNVFYDVDDLFFQLNIAKTNLSKIKVTETEKYLAYNLLLQNNKVICSYSENFFIECPVSKLSVNEIFKTINNLNLKVIWKK